MSAGINAAVVPVELRLRDQWVVWKVERRGSKWTKVPYCAVDARIKARCDDPRTWGTFEQALGRIAEVQGIGYVFSAEDPFCGVDLDDCIDASGGLHPVAAEIVASLGGYQERSPSDRGMHVIVRAELRSDRHRTADTPWGGVFEVYDRGRFFTVTGKGAAGEMDAERQSPLDVLVERMLPGASENGTEPKCNAGGNDADAPARPVDELLTTFSKLGRIVRREGKPPADASPSGWDHFLACEGVRCGLSDPDIASLIRRARAGDPKGKREAYIAGTIAAARSKASVRDGDPATRISQRWGIATNPIIGGETSGDIASGNAIVYLDRRSGPPLRFPRLGDLFDHRAHTRLVSQIARSEFPPLKNDEAVDLTQLLIRLCGGEDADPHEEARQWISDFVTGLGAITDAKLDGTTEQRWASLDERATIQRGLGYGRDAAARACGMRDDKGKLWLPATPLKSFSDARNSWPIFTARLGEIGWRREDAEMWEPGRSRAEGAKHLHTVFYVGECGPEDDPGMPE